MKVVSETKVSDATDMPPKAKPSMGLSQANAREQRRCLHPVFKGLSRHRDSLKAGVNPQISTSG
ncbi:hypothetical protein F4X90_12965 [Candidatus Poribacteria bacterium]|nr:hypothetical protein [Candidatus Poribacteria bacterium]